ncbi:hypothetical protein EIP91_009247 [Steccherinum ochraceum]|uniref:Uncharacterized protein n=1 Tax=Steccherinum ochraceum TaxID=92696 RepID=A0A4R0R465_9APHY|nr:hypothetical protein EIP91_009247 [Steccherinum ochraceum]
MFTARVFKFAVVAAGLGFVPTQVFGLSSSCESTLASIVLAPSSACLNAQALIGVVTAPANSSLVDPINNWLTGMCAQPACTNDTLSSVVSNITTGCQSDLSGLGSLSPQEIEQVVVSAYPAVRQVACLTDSNNNNGLCVTETLTAVQSSTGTTLSTNGVMQLVQQIMGGQVPNLPSSVLCTDCTKAAFNIINTQYPGLANGSVNVVGNISSTCGADFVNGSTPSTISQSANSGTQSVNPNGAASFAIAESPLGFAGVVLSSLFALGSGLAILA